MATTTKSLNFTFLAAYDPLLDTLGAQAERCFADDPTTALMKLRQLAEAMAQELASRTNVAFRRGEDQHTLLGRLRDERVLPREVADLFHGLRMAGNDAVHQNRGDHRDALHQLQMARKVAIWLHETLSGKRAQVGPFVPPRRPEDATAPLLAEVERLRAEAAHSKAAAEAARRVAEEEAERRKSAEARALAELREREAVEALLAEAAAQEAMRAEHLAERTARASEAPPADVEAVIARAQRAADHLELDEAATRRLIDQKLREAGWEADTETLTWSAGVRPQAHRNLAIAEWPTDDGRADYVLFLGLTPVAVVEAKRGARDVAAAIEQAKRYGRGYVLREGEKSPGGPWGEHRIPFLFSTNGRPYLKQLETKSGIWFLDARRAKNLSRALDGWPSPEGLQGMLRQDLDNAEARLAREPTEYLGLRDYQIAAIRAAEGAIETGQREILLAMATGTGKTRTAIGLCYRLLKTKRFRRILFLVDRTALGIQAANAFKDTRLENFQTFADIFGIKELEATAPDPETKLQVATVQGMVKRVLFTEYDVPSVDQYDCIVIDECHRGYTLDRELGDEEIGFRSEADYVSKYRRVLEHFDAVKIGLTATPAQHTVEIFGKAVHTYSYREAVVDGYLVDHEPPIRIVTRLARDGIHFRAGERVETYAASTGGVQLSLLPDNVDIEVEEFNRRVLAEGFNRAVCDFLATRIDPSLEEKTLIFCVTDAHADRVVAQLKQSFAESYGGVEDDAVLKITGSSDRPLELIRRYKNERLPNVAVTVDLLTTGIDVPRITNLVFLRRIRSRILYEQMLGRATRRADDIGKEVFRIYDAVDLYAALAPVTDMKPVVTDPNATFGKLLEELSVATTDRTKGLVVEELIAKLDRKRRRMKDDALARFEAAAGVPVEEALAFLREHGTEAAALWFAERPDLGEVLDRSGAGGAPVYISRHGDEVVAVEHGYGKGTKPDDYLEGFARYLRENMNALPALVVVTQRPRELTRKQLKELALALDRAGYSEAKLRAAFRDMTNEDIAATILGHVRRAALGDPLLAYEDRVERAVKKLLASKAWTPPQRKWLERIGKQLVKETVVDRSALDHGQFEAMGGFERLDKAFEGRLEAILGDLQEAIWRDAG